MPLPGKIRKRHKRAGRVRFERNASRIVFDPQSACFVVTWIKCDRPEEERVSGRQDPVKWVPSIHALVDLFDRGKVAHSQILPMAKAIGRAWSLGDRESLDTESAKYAAELVSQLASTYTTESQDDIATDIGQAIKCLSEEIARVRFMLTSFDDVSVNKTLDSLKRAVSECLAIPGYATWSNESQRRRFLFSLSKKERTELVYSIAALLFRCGACPLVPMGERKELRYDDEISSSKINNYLEWVMQLFRDVQSARCSSARICRIYPSSKSSS